jgi:DNA replication protein DnaC
MRQALHEQLHMPDSDQLSFIDRLSLLIDRELTEREHRRLQTRLRHAHLRQSACLEDVDLHTPRGLDKTLIQHLATGQWLREHLNCLITGPTGIGKTWLGCALAQAMCRLGFTVAYHRLPRLLEDLTLAHGDGRFPKRLAALAKTDLLVLDDWGLTPLHPEHRRDLLELLDDRHGQRSTLVTSQLPIDHWHTYLGDPTLADAILDRLIHNAYRIHLKGESLRKTRTPLTAPPVSA